MTDNPLPALVLAELRAAPAGLSEYELLQRLEPAGALGEAVADPQLQLFRKHFLLMNALYRLQRTLWDEERIHLRISPLRIALEPMTNVSTMLPAPESDAALRDYYLDWQQFARTDGAAVAALLAGFWRRLHDGRGRTAALAALELPADADWPRIKRQYRRLAAACHPDRGGDAARFLDVRAAYELLRALDT